ncbi:hypothetical protein K504DRAFT_530892 [Pleomassaria siparia CBS 279.74]|uniref:Uncharacterized protein n=1 Tax=Pleomassaria siparia CBS 279.74 TaxID=1314801 RepID=A0A6G1KME4_9PLEO|nr:hypothetical protein K504DRAFT_530892 [Pleomassaria siparia CBS 279.74]
MQSSKSIPRRLIPSYPAMSDSTCCSCLLTDGTFKFKRDCGAACTSQILPALVMASISTSGCNVPPCRRHVADTWDFFSILYRQRYLFYVHTCVISRASLREHGKGHRITSQPDMLQTSSRRRPHTDIRAGNSISRQLHQCAVPFFRRVQERGSTDSRRALPRNLLFNGGGQRDEGHGGWRRE